MIGNSDEELMKAYQAGDYPAFEELYRRYSGKVLAYLRKRLKDPQAAHEVFQGTFAKLHRSRSRYRPQYSFQQWVFVIARTVLIDHFRTSARQPELADSEFSMEQVHSDAPTPEQLFSEGEGIASGDQALLLALSDLDSRQRQVVEWRVMDELSYDEIARRLRITETNVRQILSRALKGLREKLQ